MDLRDIDVELAILLEQMEDEAADGHELLMRLTLILNQMRDLNMPVPADLLALEQKLAAEYTVPSGRHGAGRRDADPARQRQPRRCAPPSAICSAATIRSCSRAWAASPDRSLRRR